MEPHFQMIGPVSEGAHDRPGDQQAQGGDDAQGKSGQDILSRYQNGDAAIKYPPVRRATMRFRELGHASDDWALLGRDQGKRRFCARRMNARSVRACRKATS